MSVGVCGVCVCVGGGVGVCVCVCVKSHAYYFIFKFFHRGMVILWSWWPFDRFLRNYLIALIFQYNFCVS